MLNEITVTLVTPEGSRTMQVRVKDSTAEVDEHGRPARVVQLGSGADAFEFDAELMDGATIYANGATDPRWAGLEWAHATPEIEPVTKRKKR